jgi:hypothetical protein
MPSLRADRLRPILENPETIGTVMFTVLTDEYGLEFLDWEPDTLRREVQSAFGASPPQVNWDKVWALSALLTTNTFFTNLDAFLHTCLALSGEDNDFRNFTPADVSQMAWGVTEAHLLSPPDEKAGDVFNDEIRQYVRLKLEDEGFARPPKILSGIAAEGGPEPPADNGGADMQEADAIDYKAYWDRQQVNRLAVENWVGRRLLELVGKLAQLPLQHAQPDALAALQQRVQAALAGQSSALQTAAETAPRVMNP